MKEILLYLMALFYIVAGINHFLHTETYMKIMPRWLPYPLLWVYISGICEALFGLLLIPGSTRMVAAWLIIALLVAIFPANIQMMLNFRQRHSPYLWIMIIRLPMQILLIWWAWTYTRAS